MRIRDSRPLRQRLSDANLAAYLSTVGQPVSMATPAQMRRLGARYLALRYAYSRRRATLAAWDRAVAAWLTKDDPDSYVAAIRQTPVEWNSPAMVAAGL